MNQKNHSADNIPKLPFPEFRDSEGWKENVLRGKGISFFSVTGRNPALPDML